MPSAEDDAEVGGIPREEHLTMTCQQGLAELDKESQKATCVHVTHGPSCRHAVGHMVMTFHIDKRHFKCEAQPCMYLLMKLDFLDLS